jgi:hypothetical protein
MRRSEIKRWSRGRARNENVGARPETGGEPLSGRLDRLERLYLTEPKLDVALDRLIDDALWQVAESLKLSARGLPSIRIATIVQKKTILSSRSSSP